MNPTHIKSLRDDVKALATKIQHLVDSEETSQVICDLLACVRYILKSQLPSNPLPPKKPARIYDPSDDADDSPEVKTEARDKRNLREEWSGDLPNGKAKSSRRLGVDVDSFGRSGPNPDNYDVIQSDPQDKCPDCGNAIYTHPVDKNSPTDEHGNKPHIACDMTRVYCGSV